MGRTPPNSKHLEGRYDSLAGDELLKARTRANPYEMVKGAIFQNRAAMKMANMDAVFDFMFSCPRDKDKKEILGQLICSTLSTSAQDLMDFLSACFGEKPGIVKDLDLL